MLIIFIAIAPGIVITYTLSNKMVYKQRYIDWNDFFLISNIILS